MVIRKIENKRDYLTLLLLADEQENMIDLYLDKGTMFVLDGGGKSGRIPEVDRRQQHVSALWKRYVPGFATKPAVNQVEFNPLFQQKEIRALMAETDTKLEAWYPLGHGNTGLLNNPVITELAGKYGKNAGQIILRFEVQEGVITLPKSTNQERIRTNLDVFDFELTGEEMNEMRALDTGKGSHDPDAPGVEEMLRGAFVIED